MKVAGLRSMVLDDVGAREAPATEATAAPLAGSLSGTERLDQRVAAWLAERERFVRRASNRPGSQSSATASASRE